MAEGTDDSPHVIVLRAAPDNNAESEEPPREAAPRVPLAMAHVTRVERSLKGQNKNESEGIHVLE